MLKNRRWAPGWWTWLACRLYNWYLRYKRCMTIRSGLYLKIWNDDKSKTTARLIQRRTLRTIFWLVKLVSMLIKYKNDITILYSSRWLNSYFETKRSGGNDEQNKPNKVRIKGVNVGYSFYGSSHVLIPWGSNVPAKSNGKDSSFSDWITRGLDKCKWD